MESAFGLITSVTFYLINYLNIMVLRCCSDDEVMQRTLFPWPIHHELTAWRCDHLQLQNDWRFGGLSHWFVV